MNHAINRLSASRLMAMMLKEFIQLRRDRLTFAMMIFIPLVQLTLFGFAINGDPKRLPTIVVAQQQGTLTRSLVAALENTGYFKILRTDATADDAERMLREGSVQFVVTVPVDFERGIVRAAAGEERPVVLMEADAADPAATGSAVAALQGVAATALRHDASGTLPALKPATPPFELRIHKRYNPEGITAYNIVPGLMGVILTMTMIMMTGLGITREIERGTMENLLATPVRPIEVMVGKIAPYVAIGYVQVAVVLVGARFLFSVPFAGSLLVLLGCVLLFIIANLTIGITVSSMARNQTQAMQMAFFYFLPNILLSGFMFPFRGMPDWAQVIGEVLPLTHFLRLVRGVMLKGLGADAASLAALWTDVWPLLLFSAVVMVVGVKRFRRTLD
jgi:ABC-2 type transport system permease protein